jgi:hypothetical protein
MICKLEREKEITIKIGAGKRKRKEKVIASIAKIKWKEKQS